MFHDRVRGVMTICQKSLQAALALNDSWLTMSSLVLKGLGFILCFCNADLNPSTLRGWFCIRMQRNSMTAPLKLKKYLSLGRKGPRGPYSLPVKVDRPSVLQWQGIWVSTKYQNWSNHRNNQSNVWATLSGSAMACACGQENVRFHLSLGWWLPSQRRCPHFGSLHLVL